MTEGASADANIGRIATEFVMGGFKDPVKHITKLLGIAADAFNPIGGNGTMLQMVTPTALDPLAAIAENKDWTKKPIAKVAYDKTTPGSPRRRSLRCWPRSSPSHRTPVGSAPWGADRAPSS